jgi:hypothetical protein
MKPRRSEEKRKVFATEKRNKGMLQGKQISIGLVGGIG